MVTASGAGIAFMSRRSLTGYASQGLSEVYAFDAATRELTCVSCSPSGEPPSPRVGGTMAAFLPVSHDHSRQVRVVGEAGGQLARVFFDSSESLVPQDQNAKQDVYEWEREGVGSCPSGRAHGCVYLLSGGTSRSASWLLDASATGDDVFIITRAQLVSADRNGNFDVYDATDTGDPPVAATSCQGTGCQGVPPAPPTFATPASETFTGIGNFPAAGPPLPVTSHPLSRAQQLTRALKVCRAKRNRHKRDVCESRARRLYGAHAKPKASRS